VNLEADKWSVKMEPAQSSAISRWVKEELPTWGEFMNQFYLPRAINFDDEEWPEKDPYWGISKRKLIVGLACNQLNKMIIEDGCSSNPDLRFFIHDPQQRALSHDYAKIQEGIIYTISDPSGRLNPFINNYAIRRGLNLHFRGVLQMIDFAKEEFPKPIDWEVVAQIIKEMIEYFAEPIGWKDKDGKPLPTESSPHLCQGVGADPAL